MLDYRNTISVEDYLALRRAIDWPLLCKEQAQSGLENSTYITACYDNGRAVGMARIIWDKGYIAYLSDVLVAPEYQAHHIGQTLVQNAIDFVRSQLKADWKIKIVGVASKGKEGFYKKFGFVERPNETEGAGMHLWLEY